MKDFSYASFVRVRYAETDRMGVVYHGVYAQYLEIGRVEWLRSLGISYKKMEDEGIILPVTELEIYFKNPSDYDDLLRIETTLVKKPTVRIEFRYTIFKESGDLVATARTVLAFLDSRTKRPIRCPEFILQALENTS